MDKERKKEINKTIYNITRGFFNFLIWGMVFVFFLLGALHGKYQYESTLIEDVNKTLGLAGTSFVKGTYGTGEQSPDKWIFLSLAIFAVGFYFNIISVIHEEIKKWKKLKGGME